MYEENSRKEKEASRTRVTSILSISSILSMRIIFYSITMAYMDSDFVDTTTCQTLFKVESQENEVIHLPLSLSLSLCRIKVFRVAFRF